MRTFAINRIVASNENKIFLIAGPCQIESQTHAEQTAGVIKEICDDLDIDLVYKSSFDKANRSSHSRKIGTSPSYVAELPACSNTSTDLMRTVGFSG